MGQNIFKIDILSGKGSLLQPEERAMHSALPAGGVIGQVADLTGWTAGQGASATFVLLSMKVYGPSCSKQIFQQVIPLMEGELTLLDQPSCFSRSLYRYHLDPVHRSVRALHSDCAYMP